MRQNARIPLVERRGSTAAVEEAHHRKWNCKATTIPLAIFEAGSEIGSVSGYIASRERNVSRGKRLDATASVTLIPALNPDINIWVKSNLSARVKTYLIHEATSVKLEEDGRWARARGLIQMNLDGSASIPGLDMADLI
ncbi:hypothetical protein PITC_040320 [Penicillium italicum]|uniref:Uncharacterized protein n=1 Tax=Penicillium italicum TaxID=40296 RepID=A0A0A2LDT6_PENIT|nr:hypothetical protein PITC_040320 [Penicillium italicum]